MLDPQKIPLSRVKEAYRLNEHEAQSLLHELSPEGVFPYELWQKAYASYWKYPAAECSKLYKVENPPFPETHQQPTKHCPTETYAKWMVDFFFELARRISVRDLESGFDYIVESTYDSLSAVSESEREFLFYPLRLAEKNIANAARVEGVKVIDVRLSSPDVLLKIFPDTVAVDKIAAIHYLSVVQEYPFDHEVKSITRSLVESVIKAAKQERPLVPAPAPAPAQEKKDVIFVRRSLWAGKDKETICDVLRNEGITAEYIAHILLHRRGLALTQRELGELLGEPHKSESTYDKFGKKLVEKAALVSVFDAPEPENT